MFTVPWFRSGFEIYFQNSCPFKLSQSSLTKILLVWTFTHQNTQCLERAWKEYWYDAPLFFLFYLKKIFFNLHPFRPLEGHLTNNHILFQLWTRWIKQNFCAQGALLMGHAQNYWYESEICANQGIEQDKQNNSKAFRKEIAFERSLKW